MGKSSYRFTYNNRFQIFLCTDSCYGRSDNDLTALFGRFFCGFFCPLGSIIDFLTSLYLRRCVPLDGGYRIFHIKYVLLIVLIALAMFGSFFP